MENEIKFKTGTRVITNCWGHGVIVTEPIKRDDGIFYGVHLDIEHIFDPYFIHESQIITEKETYSN